jgi:hypothetical protein
MVTRITKKPTTGELGVSTKLPKSKRTKSNRARSFKQVYGYYPSPAQLREFVQGPVRKKKQVIMPVI